MCIASQSGQNHLDLSGSPGQLTQHLGEFNVRIARVEGDPAKKLKDCRGFRVLSRVAH
jgi:hypothetical protein